MSKKKAGSQKVTRPVNSDIGFFSDFLTGGGLLRDLSSHGLLGQAFDKNMLVHLGVAEKSDLWRDSWDKVVVVNVASIREAWVDGGDAEIPQAVRDLISAFPPLAVFRKQDYFFDVLVIDPFHQLVVGFGLGYRHHMFSAVSSDGKDFTDDLEDGLNEEEGAQWWARIEDLYATRPFNIIESIREDLSIIAELYEERYNLPSEWELEEALESESELESAEAKEQLERLDEIDQEIESAKKMLNLLLPSFGGSSLMTYLPH